MIREHCGKQVVPVSDNPAYFRVRCVVCKRVFKQRKRQSKKIHTLIRFLERLVESPSDTAYLG